MSRVIVLVIRKRLVQVPDPPFSCRGPEPIRDVFLLNGSEGCVEDEKWLDNTVWVGGGGCEVLG